MRKSSAIRYSAVRARAVMPLASEQPAKRMDELSRPLAILDDGLILSRDNTILAVESYKDYCRRPDALPPNHIRDLGDVLLTPGLVNCHTHLEISHMAGKTVPGKGFFEWVASLVALDRNPPSPPLIEQALSNAVASLAACGTAAVGDIASRIPRTVLRQTVSHGIASRIFCEVIGHEDAALTNAMHTAQEDTAFSLAGHALYTTPGKLVARAHQWSAAQGRPFSLHLAEHEDETRCLRDGSGKLHDLLRERVIPADWPTPGLPPVQLAASFGLLSPGTLAVHCVQCNQDDIAALATGHTAVCLCPRSNAYIAVGEAPARALAEAGVLLCLGTDSLASNTDLDVWKEAEYFLEKGILPAKALLRMATVNGARILGLSDHVGRLEKGLRFCYKTFPSEMVSLFR